MIIKPDRKKIRHKKHLRIRQRIKGTAERPRLAVFRSIKHIYAQLIDDQNGVTIVSASSLEKNHKDEFETGGNTDAGKKVGTILAQKATEKGIKSVVFDRGGNLYHGRVKAVADGARDGGLEF